MTPKIDLRDVFVDHFNTLRDASTGRISVADIFTFFIFPAIVAGVCYKFGLTIGAVAVGILVSALSILAGLLINVLVLLYTVNVVGPTKTESDEQTDLIREVNANLLYAITISVLAIIVLCMLPIFKGLSSAIVSAPVVFLIGNFVLTLLMALKRLKVLLALRFRR